jgi:hypothetical protein
VTPLIWWYVGFIDTNILARIRWALGYFKFPNFDEAWFEETKFNMETFDFIAVFTGQDHNPIRMIL